MHSRTAISSRFVRVAGVAVRGAGRDLTATIFGPMRARTSPADPLNGDFWEPSRMCRGGSAAPPSRRAGGPWLAPGYAQSPAPRFQAVRGKLDPAAEVSCNDDQMLHTPNGTCFIGRGKKPKRKQKTVAQLPGAIGGLTYVQGWTVQGMVQAEHDGRCTLFQRARLGAGGHEVHAATYGRVRHRNSTHVLAWLKSGAATTQSPRLQHRAAPAAAAAACRRRQRARRRCAAAQACAGDCIQGELAQRGRLPAGRGRAWWLFPWTNLTGP